MPSVRSSRLHGGPALCVTPAASLWLASCPAPRRPTIGLPFCRGINTGPAARGRSGSDGGAAGGDGDGNPERCLDTPGDTDILTRLTRLT